MREEGFKELASQGDNNSRAIAGGNMSAQNILYSIPKLRMPNIL